jgi:hypothetical protein
VVHELADEGEKPGKTRYTNRVIEKILHYSEETPIEKFVIYYCISAPECLVVVSG